MTVASVDTSVPLLAPEAAWAPELAGLQMYDVIRELYPICRSITGNGLRQTLSLIQRYIPLELHEVPTGTAVFDWTVPQEWNIRDAYIANFRGERLVDFRRSNLHVLGYSIPVRKRVSVEELRRHLFTLPDQPDLIPYRTAYFARNWGFCISHRQWLQLNDAEYDICIDATLEDGSLTYGEYYLQGEQLDEVLISCHACHPSLCNDNLSGIALVSFLARRLSTMSLRYSYRFLFVPGTIGAIAWLASQGTLVHRIKHGLVAACVGDPGKCTYKRSRRGCAEIDRAVTHVLRHSGNDYEILDFSPYGYDERQYCSPGFNLPVGCLMRTPYGRFPEYHTSADNLEFVRPEHLADSFRNYWEVLYLLEHNRAYRNTNPCCEPQLGKRGLYTATGGHAAPADQQLALLWVLNLADGDHTLLDIAERSGLAFLTIKEAADALRVHGLLEECAP